MIADAGRGARAVKGLRLWALGFGLEERGRRFVPGPWFFGVMVSVSLLAACSLASRPAPVARDPGAGVRVYLQPLPQETHRLNFVISSMTARRADGGEVALLAEPKEIRPDELIGHQHRLVSANLPPGDYLGLNLKIEGAALMTDEGENDLLVPEEAVAVDEAFRVRADQTTALFLSLAPDRMVTAGYRFTPRFSLWGSRPALPGLKGVVTNSAAGTLTLFEKKTPAVTNVVALGRGPGDVAFDADRSRAYIALSGEDAVAVFDLINESVRARITLRPGDGPVEMALSPDGGILVSANAGSRSVSVIDPVSFIERERLLLNDRPSSVFFDPDGQMAYVVQESSGMLTLVDARQGRIIDSVHLEDSPVRGAVGNDGKALYLITADSADLLVVDAATLRVQGRKYVGHGALCVEVDPFNGLIYVGLSTGDVMVLDPGFDLPVDTFSISGAVASLSLDTEENTLFALLPERARLEKYDLVSKKLLGAIEVDEGGYAVSVTGEQ